MRRTTAFYLFVSTLLVVIRGYTTENSEIRFESRKLPNRGMTGRRFDAREVRNRLDVDSDTTRRLSDRRIIEARRNRIDDRIDNRIADAERRYISRETREVRRMNDIASLVPDRRISKLKDDTSRFASKERKSESRGQPRNVGLESVGIPDGLKTVRKSVSRRILSNQGRRDATVEVKTLPTSKTTERSDRRAQEPNKSGENGRRSQSVSSNRRRERTTRHERNTNERDERVDSNIRERGVVRKVLTRRIRSLSRRERRRRISENERRDMDRHGRKNEEHNNRQTDVRTGFSGSDNFFHLNKGLQVRMQARRQETSGRMDNSSRSRRMDDLGAGVRYNPKKTLTQLSRTSRDLGVRSKRMSGQETDVSFERNNRRNQRRNENTDYNRRQRIETRLESRRISVTRNDPDNNVNRVDAWRTISKKISEKRTENTAVFNQGVDIGTRNKSHTQKIYSGRSITTSNMHRLTIHHRFFLIQKVYHRNDRTEQYQDQSRRVDASRRIQISTPKNRRLNHQDLLDADRTISAMSDRLDDKYMREDRRQVQRVLNKNKCAYRQPTRELQRRGAITERVSRDERGFFKAAVDSRIDRKLGERQSTSVGRLVRSCNTSFDSLEEKETLSRKEKKKMVPFPHKYSSFLLIAQKVLEVYSIVFITVTLFSAIHFNLKLTFHYTVRKECLFKSFVNIKEKYPKGVYQTLFKAFKRFVKMTRVFARHLVLFISRFFAKGGLIQHHYAGHQARRHIHVNFAYSVVSDQPAQSAQANVKRHFPFHEILLGCFHRKPEVLL